MTLNVLLHLILNEKVNAKDIEIVTFFAGHQFFLRKEIRNLAKVIIFFYCFFLINIII